MKRRTGLAALSAVILLSSGLVACSGQSAPDGGSSQGGGTLVVYTGSGTEVTDPLFAAFAKVNPGINVQIVNAGSGELLARIKAEKDNPGGDIFLGASPASFNSAPELFQAYESANDADHIAIDPNHLWHGWDVMPQAILVNTTLLPDESAWPKTLDDLAAPAWEGGKVAFADPTKSGTGTAIVASLAAAKDDAFMASFAKNLTILAGSDAMFDAVKDGSQPVGFINEDLGSKWEKAGVPVKMIYPADGVTNSLDTFGIIAGGKNHDNAKKFVDFLTSPAGAEVTVKEILRRSTRTDAPTPEGLPEISTLKMIDTGDVDASAATDEFMKIVAEARK